MKFSIMKTAKLVEFYNANSGKPPIKKFSDRKTAVKRCEALNVKPTKKKAAKALSGTITAIKADSVFRSASMRKHVFEACKVNKSMPTAVKDVPDKTVAAILKDFIRLEIISL